MPLLDHFRPPLFPCRHWESFHVTWAGAVADALNEHLLPDGYFAEEHVRGDEAVEVGMATLPSEFEVRVHNAAAQLIAAVELVSPANKDREAHRRAFAAKCAGYLAQGVSLVVVDVVTSRRANLHADVMRLLGRDAGTGLPPDADLYATAYRPVVRGGSEVVDVWAEPLAVGRDLPTLPLALTADLCLPIDLEATYTTACGRRRLG